MAVASGVVQYARAKGDWQVRGQGPWFFSLDQEALSECDALIARIEDDQEALFCASLGIPVVDIAGSSSLKLFSQVRNDDYQTGVSAGTYLKKLGSKNVGWCGVDLLQTYLQSFQTRSHAVPAKSLLLSAFHHELI